MIEQLAANLESHMIWYGGVDALKLYTSAYLKDATYDFQHSLVKAKFPLASVTAQHKYLYNMALKLVTNHLSSDVYVPSNREELTISDCIIKLISQETRIYNTINFSASVTTLEQLQRAALHATVFDEIQYTLSGTVKLIDGFFRSYYEADSQHPFDKLVLMLIYLLKGVENAIHGGQIENTGSLTREQIDGLLQNPTAALGQYIRDQFGISLVPISANDVERFITLFSSDSPQNSDYSLPIDYDKNDSWRYVLTSLGDSSFATPILPLNVFGAFECLFARYKDQSRNDFGNEFESVVKQSVENQFNITTYTGKFTFTGEMGESDIIFIVDNVIFCVECKKKAMTRLARSGQALNVILDIAKSYLKPTLQAFRFELATRTLGSIRLYDPDESDRDILSGRAVPSVNIPLSSLNKPRFMRINLTPYNGSTRNRVGKFRIKRGVKH